MFKDDFLHIQKISLNAGSISRGSSPLPSFDLDPKLKFHYVSVCDDSASSEIYTVCSDSSESYSECCDIASFRAQEHWQLSAAHIVPLYFVPYSFQMLCCRKMGRNFIDAGALSQVCMLGVLKLGQALLSLYEHLSTFFYFLFHIQPLTPLLCHITWIILLLWSHLLTRS